MQLSADLLGSDLSDLYGTGYMSAKRAREVGAVKQTTQIG